MQATKETVQKRPHTALWIILCVVLLCAAGAALYFCRWAEKPLTLAEGYVAAEGLTADITDGEGAVLSQPVRGTKVTYVVEDEDKDHPVWCGWCWGRTASGYLPVRAGNGSQGSGGHENHLRPHGGEPAG